MSLSGTFSSSKNSIISSFLFRNLRKNKIFILGCGKNKKIIAFYILIPRRSVVVCFRRVIYLNIGADKPKVLVLISFNPGSSCP